MFADVSSLLIILFPLMAGPTSEPENKTDAATTGGKERHQLRFSQVCGDLISILPLRWREAKLVIWNAF